MAKILMIDDNAFMRQNLKKVLESLGHEIVGEADDGSKAVSSYEECNPDIVTLDIVMGYVNGLEALKNLKENYPNSKIIMVSSMGQKSNVLEAMKLGAEHFILKPIDKNKLEEVINFVLEKESNKINKGLLTKKNKIDKTSSDEKKNQALNDTSQPIFVSLKNNFLEIIVNHTIDVEMIDLLNKTVKGFLIIKPLNIIFNIENTNFLNNNMETEFKRIINKITIIGGEVKLIH